MPYSGYESVIPSNVTRTRTTGTSAMNTTNVYHDVARAEAEQAEHRQHPERLNEVGERLSKIV